MHDELLADLDRIDFPQQTGIAQSQTIPWLLSALADKAATPQDAERIGATLREELGQEQYADGPARPLAASFLARMVIGHDWEHVQITALRLIHDLELDVMARESELAAQVIAESCKLAFAAMRQALPGDDVSGAIGLVFGLRGCEPRLFKQLRRLELRSRHPQVSEAIAAVRAQCSAGQRLSLSRN
jgi:hypothetical protein